MIQECRNVDLPEAVIRKGPLRVRSRLTAAGLLGERGNALALDDI